MSYFDQNSTCFAAFFSKNTIQTQENVFPNFFPKVATELELLGPKIALWYFSNLNILHFYKKKLKEGDFLANCSKHCQLKYKKIVFLKKMTKNGRIFHMNIVSFRKQYLKLHKIRTGEDFPIIFFWKTKKSALSRNLYLRRF